MLHYLNTPIGHSIFFLLLK